MTMIALCLFGCERQAGSADQPSQFAIDQIIQQDGISIHLKVDREQINIAQTLHFRLEAIVEESYDIQMPSLSDSLDPYALTILDSEMPSDKLTDKQSRLIVRDYVLEPVIVGDHEIPALTFEVKSRSQAASGPHTAAEAFTLTSEPITIHVTALTAADQQELSLTDIKGVVPLKSSWQGKWLWLVIAFFILLVVFVLLIRRFARKTPAQKRIMKSAYQIADDALNRLEAENLLALGRLKEFYERINLILRRYIEHRFDLRAPERTTEEFLLEAGRTDHLSQTHKEMLKDFLTHCDQVKFARYTPSVAEIDKTLSLTRDFLQATRSDERQVDVTGQTLDHFESSAQPVGGQA